MSRNQSAGSRTKAAQHRAIAADCTGVMGPEPSFAHLPGAGSPGSGSPDSGSPDSGSPDSGAPGSGAPGGLPHRIHRWLATPVTAAYIALVALIAQGSGISYVLFPELGALAHDVFQRPHGAWARSPVMLLLTPAVTAVIGTILTRHMAYGPISVLLSVGSSILIIRLLRSPIAPAISAGLLPLTLGISSWLYAPSILVGTVMLAGLAVVQARLVPPAPQTLRNLTDDIMERPPSRYTWVPFYLGFLTIASTIAGLTGWRLLLFPPLVVMGFEMFAHASVCPWAKRPVMLPLACTATALGGLAVITLFGITPLAAIISTLLGVIVLRVLDLHVPPAVAVGLLPFVIPHPNVVFPLSVGIGTTFLTLTFLAWRAVTGIPRAEIAAGVATQPLDQE